MNLPTMIEDLIFAIETKRAEWDSTLGQLTEKQVLHPRVVGKWSVKDVIAHVSWFEQQMEWMVTRHSMDIPEVELWELPTDERNEVIYQQYKDKSLPAVMEMAQSRYQRMLSALKQLEDKDLTDASSYEGMPEGWVPADIIAQNTWLHYADHLVIIKKQFGL